MEIESGDETPSDEDKELGDAVEAEPPKKQPLYAYAPSQGGG